MIDPSTIIWTCAIFSIIILITIIGISDYIKKKKQFEYELDHPQATVEYEFHVKIRDIKCNVINSENTKRPVAEKCFIVYYEILDSETDEKNKNGYTSVDEETYHSLMIGMTGYMAFVNDVFFGFVSDEE